MRIGRLNLIRYGSLTDRELVFRPDAAIHVVYGENEAGKSTALTALSDLLFGFGHAKTQDFLHDAASLRLGATLLRSDGNTISFRRRRGNKNTLLASDDTEEPLRDDVLLPYLGNVNRSVFERAFGLDSSRLRAGSEEMLKSGGEMGTMLFAASSGILGLTAARHALEADAEKIFTPRRSGQRVFYQLLDKHEEARAKERNSELRSSDWKRLNEDIDNLQKEHEELTRQRAAVRQRQGEIDNLKRLKPVFAEMDEEAGRLSEYDDIAVLPDGMGAGIALALDACRNTEASMKQARAAVEKAQRDLDRIELHPVLVSRLPEISALFEERSAIRADIKDLPRVRGERERFSSQLGEIAGRVGIERQSFDARQPSDPEIARVEERLNRFHKAEAAIESIDRRIREDRESLLRLEEERPQEALIDPQAWRSRIAALQPDVDRLASLETARAELNGKRRKLGERAARLDPSIQDLDGLARSPLPTRSEIASHRDAINEAEAKVKTSAGRMDAAQEEMDKLGEGIAADEEGAVPTRQSIAAARQSRDAAIASLGSNGAETLSPEERGRAIDHIQGLVQAADILADSALRGADRVARLTANIERREALAKTISELAQLLGEQEAILAGLRSDYMETFGTAGIEALQPNLMMDWLATIETLLEQREEIETEAERIAACGDLEQELLGPLRAVAEGIRVSGHVTLPVPALARAIEDRLQTIQRVWEESRENTISRQQCEGRLERLASDRLGAVTARDTEAERLRDDATPLGLREDVTAVEIAAAVAAWKQVPQIREEEQNRIRRVRGMERDIASFEKKVVQLMEDVCPDLGSLTPVDAIGLLNERARQANSASERARDASTVLADAKQHETEAARAQEDARTVLLDALDGHIPLEEAGKLADRLSARDGFSEKLAACRKRFRQVAPDMEEADVRAALDGFDPVEAEAEVERLRLDEIDLDSQVNETYAKLSARRTERSSLAQSSGAEQAAFERRAIEAGMADVAREWTVLKLASSLLGAAIEKQRQAKADPALASAGESFRTLTRGAFSQLSKRFNEDDVAELTAVRHTGQEIGLEEMSDGTLDQLHLALRIAYLQDYAGRNEPMPFIADDIFQTFDDNRTRAAIAALGEVSATVQPIVFTHHDGVVAAARKVLGDRADIIELRP